MNRWLCRPKTATPENEVEGIATDRDAAARRCRHRKKKYAVTAATSVTVVTSVTDATPTPQRRY